MTMMKALIWHLKAPGGSDGEDDEKPVASKARYSGDEIKVLSCELCKAKSKDFQI